MGAKKHKKKERSDVTWVERDTFVSPAWRATSNIEKFVYGIFLLKRQYSGSEKKRVGISMIQIYTPQLMNNGEIQFTYKEAKNKYGISRERFRSAIKGLVEKGFIFIKRPGVPAQRVPTLFGFSDEWRKFGTTQFKPGVLPENVWFRPTEFQGERYVKKKSNKATD